MIQAFRELNDNESRMAALDALTQELSPYEWRTVASKLHARTFQFDLVRNLPVEIVVTIFSYLDTTTPFRLQAVRLPVHLNFDPGGPPSSCARDLRPS